MSSSRSLAILFLLLIIPRLSQAQTEYNIPHDGGNIHVEVYGSGDKPLLVINGGPGMNSVGFRPLAQKLGEERLTIIYDQRGTGQSTMTKVNDQTMTLDKMIADIEVVREYLGFEKWTVMGHSFGGMLASYYATQHPNRINGMVLSSSGGIDMDLFSALNIRSRLTETQRDSLQYWANQIQAGDTSYHARYHRGLHLAPAYLVKQEFVPQVADRLTQANYTVNGLVFQNMRAIDFDCSEELRKFKAPVLIIQGKQDIIPVSLSEKAHQVLPNSKLLVMDECAHYGWLEQPKQYFGSIHRFLDDCWQPTLGHHSK